MRLRAHSWCHTLLFDARLWRWTVYPLLAGITYWIKVLGALMAVLAPALLIASFIYAMRRSDPNRAKANEGTSRSERPQKPRA